MLVNMLKSKIHRATVTTADLSYVGSITIAAAVMAAANILPGEKIQVATSTPATASKPIPWRAGQLAASSV
jgi:aspartate 1-decarboxylase